MFPLFTVLFGLKNAAKTTKSFVIWKITRYALIKAEEQTLSLMIFNLNVETLQMRLEFGWQLKKIHG